MTTADYPMTATRVTWPHAPERRAATPEELIANDQRNATSELRFLRGAVAASSAEWMSNWRSAEWSVMAVSLDAVSPSRGDLLAELAAAREARMAHLEAIAERAEQADADRVWESAGW